MSEPVKPPYPTIAKINDIKRQINTAAVELRRLKRFEASAADIDRQAKFLSALNVELHEVGAKW